MLALPLPFAAEVVLTDVQRQELDKLARACFTPQALAFRARVVLQASDPDRPQFADRGRVWLRATHDGEVAKLFSHGSWLNQVELWFGVLARRFLQRGDFCSAEDFENRIQAYLDDYNR